MRFILAGLAGLNIGVGVLNIALGATGHPVNLAVGVFCVVVGFSSILIHAGA